MELENVCLAWNPARQQFDTQTSSNLSSASENSSVELHTKNRHKFGSTVPVLLEPEMKIAVEGCMHGELDNVYATLVHIQEVEKIKVDLLICCGDFQAIRNDRDLESLNVPAKYRHMNTFHKYYSGEKVAPIPTIFIGGNHEASNYLWELYYGGWAAPQIYFLGIAGVVKFGNVRIGGMSGIYNRHDYYSGHYEKLPYNEKDIRSIYHVREFDFYKLMQLEEPIDIFMSHDWPLGITSCGDLQNLLRQKPFFEQEIREGTLGNRAAAELLEKLKPSHWFSAHLHCKFPALVQHEENGSVTNFLALDKCLPGRKFLQIVNIPSEVGPYELRYDEEWLAITRKFNPAFPRTRYRANFGNAKLDIQDCRHFVRNKLQLIGGKPFEFVRSAPCYIPGQPVSTKSPSRVGHCRNPQTEALLQLLELQYILDDSSLSKEPSPFPSSGSLDFRSEDIPIDDIEDDEDEVDAET